MQNGPFKKVFSNKLSYILIKHKRMNVELTNAAISVACVLLSYIDNMQIQLLSYVLLAPRFNHIITSVFLWTQLLLLIMIFTEYNLTLSLLLSIYHFLLRKSYCFSIMIYLFIRTVLNIFEALFWFQNWASYIINL